jgi:hypothetical protein
MGLSDEGAVVSRLCSRVPRRVLHDGDAVDLGGAKLVAHLTPGHTKGCTTWTNPFLDPDGYKTYVAERNEAFRKEWARQQQNPGN